MAFFVFLIINLAPIQYTNSQDKSGEFAMAQGSATRIAKFIKWSVIGISTVLVTSAITGWYIHHKQFSDDAPYRGMLKMADTQFDGGIKRMYPSPDFPDWPQSERWQGWSTEQSLWFYNTTQGSALLPYDFFMVLQQAGSDKLFRADQHIDSFKYIPQQASKLNPEGLPLGFVKDTYQNRSYIGFTCAACHTSQVVYGDTAIRIDGGPAMANMEKMMRALEAALTMTLNKPEKQQAFVDAVLARSAPTLLHGKEYATAEQVIADLKKYTVQISLYNFINQSDTQYGYARLDAFGRIYNRVLQHVLNKKQLTQVIEALFSPEQAEKLVAHLPQGVVGDDEFAHIFEQLVQSLDLTAQNPNLANNMAMLKKLRSALFNSPNAPVSYPFLWDIAQHDYVQWNGIAANAGVGAIGRNTGEVIGVFAILDWHERKKANLSTLIGKQAQNDNGAYTQFDSSVNVTNLRLIESQLKGLQSPKWPELVLPAIDKAKAARGEKHFDKHCAACHQEIETTNPNRKVIAQMSSLEEVQTDPAMAANSVNYQGHSGIVEGIYQSTGLGDLLIQEKAAVATLLSAATTNVVATPDPDKNIAVRWFDWMYNLAVTFFDNDIKPSLKRGNYELDNAISPYNSLLAYKGRPLNGIWATAPYLHNGSVPTLYDLLLPATSNDPEQKVRPQSFIVGSRKLDVKKVGFETQGYNGFTLDTTLPGNSNLGHEYGTSPRVLASGDVIAPLTDTERWELVEYLKTL